MNLDLKNCDLRKNFDLRKIFLRPNVLFKKIGRFLTILEEFSKKKKFNNDFHIFLFNG